MRWRWPPETCEPPRPTGVAIPSGSERDPLPQAGLGERGLDVGVGRLGAGQPHVVGDRRGEQVGVLVGEPDNAAHIALRELAQVDPAERDPALLGIEEADEQPGERRLARAARAGERDPAAGRQAQRRPVEHPRGAGLVAHAHVLAARGRPPAGAAGRRGRAPAAGAAVILGQALGGLGAGAEMARGVGQRRDRLERAEREQDDRREQDAVERPVADRDDPDGGDGDRGAVGQRAFRPRRPLRRRARRGAAGARAARPRRRRGRLRRPRARARRARARRR